MPDISALFTSQPGWVVVVVVLIAAGAYVLRPMLIGRYGRDDDDEPAPPGAHAAPGGAAVETLTSTRGRGYDAILAALDRLHEVATREAARGDEAERERDELGRALDRALRDLADCERRALAGPVRFANEYADRRDVGATAPRPGRRRRVEDTDPRARWAPRDAG